MITGVAFVPQAPALVPEVGRGLDAELGPVRAACRTAIRRVAAPGTRVVVIGSADMAGEYGPTARGTFAGFGVPLEVSLGSDQPGPVDLPPSLIVGAWLVRDALGPNTGATGIAVSGWQSLALTGDEPIALVVLGEGSARRTEKAPGYLDERAAEHDRRLAFTLASGEGWRLNDPLTDPRDPIPAEDVEADLLVSGHWVRDSVATAPEALGDFDAELLYEGAPFGVGYFVAAWTHRG